MLIRLLRQYLAPYRSMIIGTVLLSLVGTMAALYLPSLNASIIDDGVAQGDTALIWSLGGVMLAVSAVQIVCSIGSVYFGAKTAMAFGRDVRGAIFERVLTFSARELNSYGAPSLITRNTNDVQQVQMLVVMSATVILSAPITMVGGIFMALQEDVGLSWLVAVAVPALALSILAVVRGLPPLFRLMQGRIDVVNRILREQIGGIRVVRAFVREPYETERFAQASGELTSTQLAVGRRLAIMFPLVMLILNVFSVAVLWFGAMRVDSGQMQIGSLTAFLTYLVQILMAVMMATFLLMLAPRAIVCAERIGEVLDTASTVVTAPNPVTTLPTVVGGPAGGRRFHLPRCRLPGPVQRDVHRPAGRDHGHHRLHRGRQDHPGLAAAAAVRRHGRPGAGRRGGRTELEPELLWSRIGLVPQKPFLFTGTVASNLRYGNPEATDDELWHALRVAQADDFVAQMAGQLEAPISQGGTNVSGGQRQRLSIARALVKKPEIYIFDDSFSALDVATDARLRAALKRETTDACVIIVGQRVATIAEADKILVLEDGRVVGSGTHDELLATCSDVRRDRRLAAQRRGGGGMNTGSEATSGPPARCVA